LAYLQPIRRRSLITVVACCGNAGSVRGCWRILGEDTRPCES
jgi:hypothetical protein